VTAEKLGAALEATTFNAPRIPVISNVDVLPHTDAASIRATLAKQLTSPVMWAGQPGPHTLPY